MAIYNTGPTWTPLSEITAAKLQQMVDNIQYVKDKVDGINIPAPPTPTISYGVLARATKTANTNAPGGSETTVSDLTVTVNGFPGGRLIRHNWSVRSFNSAGAGSTWAIRTFRGATLIGEMSMVLVGGGGDMGGSYFSLDAPSAGDHTYTITMIRVAGTGDLIWEANPTNPSFAMIEDLGAA